MSIMATLRLEWWIEVLVRGLGGAVYVSALAAAARIALAVLSCGVRPRPRSPRLTHEIPRIDPHRQARLEAARTRSPAPPVSPGRTPTRCAERAHPRTGLLFPRLDLGGARVHTTAVPKASVQWTRCFGGMHCDQCHDEEGERQSGRAVSADWADTPCQAALLLTALGSRPVTDTVPADHLTVDSHGIASVASPCSGLGLPRIKRCLYLAVYIVLSYSLSRVPAPASLPAALVPIQGLVSFMWIVVLVETYVRHTDRDAVRPIAIAVGCAMVRGPSQCRAR